MNLTCEELLQLLYDHHEGSLAIEVRESFAAHLVICRDCTHYVESYTHTVRIVRKLPRCALPHEMEARLRAKLSEYLGKKGK